MTSMAGWRTTARAIPRGVARGTRGAARGTARAAVRTRGWGRRHRVLHRLAVAAGLLVVALVGMSLGLLLGGRVHQDVGPFAAQFAMRPSVSGGTSVQIPPLGSLDLHSHSGPAHLDVTLDALDQKRAEALVNNPGGINAASQGAVQDVQRGVTRLAFQSAGAAVLGAMLLAAMIYRDMRRVAMTGGLATVLIAATGAIALGTFRPNSVEEPQYHGLLANAPAVIGDARNIANRFDAYKAELQRLVNNVSRLYGTVSTLPVYQPDSGTVRALHVSDLHLNPAAWPVIKTVVQQYQINLVIDTGDINDWGTAMESSFVDSIATLGVPYVYVRGNHDSALTAAAVARQPNAVVLENSVKRVAGLTIGGIGDPRFTPDKSTAANADHPEGAPVHQEADELVGTGETLASTIRRNGAPVDVALVHDPVTAGGLAGSVPLVLAGHLHHRETSTLKGSGDKSTFVMVEGSTGGAGLRGLEGEQPTPLEMSVLYFDPGGALQAYDEITLGGTGEAQASINRHVIKNNLNPPPSESPSPAPSR
jgi:predicted phosphodiesterase